MFLPSIRRCFLLCLICTFALHPLAARSNDSEHECTCSPKQISKAFSNVAKEAMPAVVFIKVESCDSDEGYEHPGSQGMPSPYDNFGDDFFNRFFGGPGRAQKPQPQLSQGSGFIITPDGYIVTNAHVVHQADKMTVTMNDGSEANATLIGEDPHTDLAVIKIDGTNLPYVSFGDSETMDIGEWVVAIGSPFQLEASLTVGVISAKGRQNLRITDLEDFIQTDAAINPGNSGGPLLNLDSEVIGINTAIVSRSGGYMGIGFAIPSNMAKVITEQIISKGNVTRGFLGISMQPVDKDIADAFNLDRAEGALVAEVVKDSPAEKAGVKQGDIILEYNGCTIKSIGGFRKDVSMMQPGTTISLKINRKGEIITIPVELSIAVSDQISNNGAVQKLGFEVSNLTPDLAQKLGYKADEEAVVITKIKPGSPSAQAGLRPGFLIIAINHKKVKNVEEFNEVLNETGSKKRILILARQGNLTRFYSLKMD